ncbi:MAG: hypothetical protein M1823_007733, partial [Watsoniomyces obsoletus]
PGFVVGGEDAHVGTTDKVVVVHWEHWVAGRQELGVKDDLDAVAAELARHLIEDVDGPRTHEPWIRAALQRLDDLEESDVEEPEPGLARALGLPVRSYLMWRRFRRALSALQTGADLTTIAHEVGFYDLAQMSRTFMTYYGYQPSRLKRPEVLRIVAG